MTDPTISQLCRTIQKELSTINNVLHTTRTLAQDIGLTPFRIANIQAAINDNEHAWQELNTVATALELTGADFRDPPSTAPTLEGP